MRRSIILITILALGLILAFVFPASAASDDFVPPQRDCFEGPDPGSDEWEQADEWREWWEANCQDCPTDGTPCHEDHDELCTDFEDAPFCRGDSDQDDEVIVAEEDTQVGQVEVAGTEEGHEVVASATSTVEELPATGLHTLLLTLLGLSLIAGGTTALRR